MNLNHSTARSIMVLRLVGGLLVAITLLAMGYAWYAADRSLRNFERQFAEVAAQTGASVHLHDTHYVVASPGWIAAAILVIVIGSVMATFPRVLLGLFRKV